nr:hypothetical protein [Tanacetum cinerariifolium]
KDLNEDFAECINNSSNEVNAAGSLVSAAGLNFINSTNDFSAAGPSNAAMPNLEDLSHNADDKVWILVNLPYGKRAIGTKWVYRNKKDERGIVIRNKARLVAQGHTQEEGINYEELMPPLWDFQCTKWMSKVHFSMAPLKKKCSTSIDAEKPLLKNSDGEDVDVHTYRYEELASPKANGSWENDNWMFVMNFELNAARLSKFLLSGKYAAQGFEQIIDFLSGSYIHHALTVNPHVYISFIKQFWNTAVVKRSGDVTRLQALVDKKRIVITEEVVHEILQLDDAKGVICLPNDEIFAGLARMGYEKTSTKLTFYKAFFLTQWKFFIHTILHSLSAKGTSWNEFSSAMASALICLSSGQRFNFSKYIFESLVRNVNSSSKFYMYPRFIQLIIQSNIADLSKHTNRYISSVLTQKVFANMRRVRKGFSGVETPFFKNMLVVRAVDADGEVQVPAQDDVIQEHVIEEIATEVIPPTPTSPLPSSPVIPSTPPHQSPSLPPPQAVEGLETTNVAQQLEIIKLKASMKKLERLNKVKSSKLRRLKKVGTSQRVESSEDVENVFNQGRISVDMEMNERIKLEVTAASAPILAAKPKVLKIAAAPAVSTRRRKGVVIRDPEEELHTDTLAETPTVKDKGKGILIEDPRHMKKKDQIEMDA